MSPVDPIGIGYSADTCGARVLTGHSLSRYGKPWSYRRALAELTQNRLLALVLSKSVIAVHYDLHAERSVFVCLSLRYNIRWWLKSVGTFMKVSVSDSVTNKSFTRCHVRRHWLTVRSAFTPSFSYRPAIALRNAWKGGKERGREGRLPNVPPTSHSWLRYWAWSLSGELPIFWFPFNV